MAKILLIDDNPGLLKMEAAFLRAAGHETVSADDGRSALQMAATETFDLVVTDIVMPGKDGMEVIMALLSRTPTLKIIAVSGGGHLSAENYLRLAGTLGAVETLQKPFSGDELVEAVTRALGGDGEG